jgi:hypothetical protein
MSYKKNLPPQLQNYEMVEDRLVRFWKHCPNGRLKTEVVEIFDNGDRVLMKATMWINREDSHPVSTGIAMDWKNKKGMVNSTNWIENTETSCLGRCISSSPFATEQTTARWLGMKEQEVKKLGKAPRPSREEMEIALGRQKQLKAKEEQPEVDEFYKEVEDVSENPPIENKEVSKEDLEEIEELNKETIDGWVDNVKAEYHKKMVALNPNIDKDDVRMHLNKAFIEKETLEKGRKKFQDGVDHWNKMVKTKPYDIEDREKGDINLSDSLYTVEPKDIPSMMDDAGIKGELQDSFEDFPKLVKKITYKNPDYASSTKQQGLILKCCTYRNIERERLDKYLKQELNTKLSDLTIQEASWLIDGFFGESKK